MHPATIALKTAYQHRPKITIGSQMTTALLATGAGLAMFLGIRAVFIKFKKGIREQAALREGDPASYAVLIKMAFDNDNAFGWGTDEELLFSVLESIPSQHVLRQVQRAYRDLNKSNLSTDLKEELDSEEYAAALELINTKPTRIIHLKNR